MFETTHQIPFRDVTPAEARTMVEGGALVVDVREPFEWVAGHIAGARHVPLGRISPREVPGDRPVVLVCRSGNRSGVAAELLVAAGHPDVANLAGGMIAWEAAGFPLVSGNGSTRAV